MMDQSKQAIPLQEMEKALQMLVVMEVSRSFLVTQTDQQQ